METSLSSLPGEKALAARAAADRAAFAAIYDHYFPRVYNYLRYRVGNARQADELTALTFERALARIGSFDPGRSSFGAWLFAIARNAAIDHLRACRRRRWVSLAWLSGRRSPEPAPDEVLLAKERRHLLLAAVRRLDDREREILGLKFAAGQTNREIARLTGIGESHVGVILFRAIRKLRVRLQDEERDHE